MDVGVHELKQRLSEYLELVAKGEIIWVTDRDRHVPTEAGRIEAGWLCPASALRREAFSGPV